MKNAGSFKVVFAAAVLLIALASPSCLAQGTLPSEHHGLNDPTTEGFLGYLIGPAVVGGITNDFELDSWSMNLPSDSSAKYYAVLPDLVGRDWVLTARLRMLPVPGASFLGPFFVGMGTGSGYMAMRLGVLANGDSISSVYNTVSYTTNVVLEGTGPTYHTYQLVYNAAADTADYWIDGVLRIPAIPNNGTDNTTSYVQWGGSNPSALPVSLQADWNTVTIESVPEPSVVRCLACGAAVAICCLFRGGRRRQTRGKPKRVDEKYA